MADEMKESAPSFVTIKLGGNKWKVANESEEDIRV